MKTLSLIIPVYYNEGSLLLLFDKILEVEIILLSLEINLELIYVDDGSGDNSLNILLKIKQKRPTTKIIKLTRNFGVVNATKTALKFVTGDCFTFLAADLQDPPELIIEMIKKWKSGSKFIICERVSREDPPLSKLFSTVYYKVLNNLVLKDYPKGGFDMALMDRVFLDPLVNSSKSLYIPLLAFWLGYTPEVLHYHRKEREHGKSRWTFAKKINAFLDVMLGFSVTPIRFISAIGLVVSSFSFLYGAFVVINTLLGNYEVKGFASLVALITFLLGLIIIMLGVIGEYLWRVFAEVNRRPEAVIDEIY